MLYDGKIWVATDSSHKPVFLLPQMANRHGLIAGATGTGKTVTLKVIAEGFSDMGVPVFMGDIKGDLSGMVIPGTVSEKIGKRLMETGVSAFRTETYPTVFWDVYGEQGHPVRATISEMGPLLLSRMLNLNETQSGVLNILFRVAADEGLPLYTVKDLKAMLAYVGENASRYTLHYGNVSKASIGAIQRAVAVLEDQGGDCFFGEPSLQISDWMRTDENGKGYINILACDKLFLSPLMYSTFLLWMLSRLYELLPERGDLEKPLMVFFFDEAHLLFNDCSKQLMEKVEQVVRLIRSKGVGVYFITQNPSDVPMSILGQLGNRVQHALRAFTPLDQKAVKVAAQTFRVNPEFDTESAISELKTGEALISFLDEYGAPGVVQRATVLPPQSSMGAISAEKRAEVIESSPMAGRYDLPIVMEGAYAILMKEQEESQKEEPQQSSGPIFIDDMNEFLAQLNAQTAVPAGSRTVVYDPLTGQYIQKEPEMMENQNNNPQIPAQADQTAQPVQYAPQQYVQQVPQQQPYVPVQQYAQQPYTPVQQVPVQYAAQQPVVMQQPVAQPVQQTVMQQPAAQAQVITQNVLVLDPTTGGYVQKQMTLAYNPATGQYVPVQTEAEAKAAAKAAKEAQAAQEKVEREAARKAKEEEAAERRQRNDELREERAERARANNSVLGRVKNTAINSATRTVTNKLTNELLKGLGLGKKK